MPLRRNRPWLFASMLLLASFLSLTILPEIIESAEEAQGADQPKLVVLVVFDQMRGEYLQKWENLYDKDGFGRILRDGAWYQNCHYPYCFTLTAAGHTSIVTGCPPNKHGIIANEWYDREARAEVSAVRGDRYPLVPQGPDAKDQAEGAAPIRRHQPAVGDSLLKNNQKAKVVSLSIKDRAAILMAALRATAVYWFHTTRGLFVTSTYYRDVPHPWIREYNATEPADKYFGMDWIRLRTDLDYAKLSGPDDVSPEGIGYGQGRTFPHPTTGGLKTPGRKFYDAVTNSPFGNDLLLDLAKKAIDAEQLGQRDACDLLCLSFSSNDVVGHCYGPDSQEVLDITLRSDLIIKELLAYLDAKVGKDRYVLLMTADHGVGQIPELATAAGKAGGRIPPTLFTKSAHDFLQATFAPQEKTPLPWIEKFSSGWVYLNYGTVAERKLDAGKVGQTLAEWLAQQPGIQAAYSRSRLEKGAGEFKEDPIGETVRLSYYPTCSGDVGVVLKPYHLVSTIITDTKNDAYRATHGTPHPYDTHVPFVIYGAGVQPGIRTERIAPLSAAAILARALDVPPPDGAEYPVPEGLFKKKVGS
jgi:hypothetical protein